MLISKGRKRHWFPGSYHKLQSINWCTWELRQTGLIKWVVEALGLDDRYAKGKQHTPAETKPLVKECRWEKLMADSIMIAVLLECCSISSVWPHLPHLPMLSIVVLGKCSAQSTHMSWLWNALVDTSNRRLIKEWWQNPSTKLFKIWCLSQCWLGKTW